MKWPHKAKFGFRIAISRKTSRFGFRKNSQKVSDLKKIMKNIVVSPPIPFRLGDLFILVPKALIELKRLHTFDHLILNI